MFAIKAYELYNTRDNTRGKQAKAWCFYWVL